MSPRIALLALALAVAGCTDRTDPEPPIRAPSSPPPAVRQGASPAARDARERLARRLAHALAELARVLHPGGRRIIEVMAEQLGLHNGDLAPTEAVLSEHGNMSSVTVLFVLDEILRRHRPRPGEKGVLGAFGPGFGAELALLEFS